MSQLAGLSPYMIQGNLNFGAPTMDYMGAYGNALSLNQQNYQNTLAGYQGLNQSVLGNLQGIGASREQDIFDTYAQESGKQTQQLISRGLGNTTVQNSIQRGLVADREKQRTALANQIADMYARYQSMLGTQQLGMMERVSAPYPDVNAYNRLAQQRGALRAGANSGRAGVGAGAFSGGYGYAPSRGGFSGVGSFNPGVSTVGSQIAGSYMPPMPQRNPQGPTTTQPVGVDYYDSLFDINNEDLPYGGTGYDGYTYDDVGYYEDIGAGQDQGWLYEGYDYGTTDGYDWTMDNGWMYADVGANEDYGAGADAGWLYEGWDY